VLGTKPAELKNKVRAFCTITLDNEFVVHDVKLIERDGSKGPVGLFMAMPARRFTCRCPNCGDRNHSRAKFCNRCGAKLSFQVIFNGKGCEKLYEDMAHPINAACRQRIEQAVLAAYERERQKAGQKPDCQEPTENEVS